MLQAGISTYESPGFDLLVESNTTLKIPASTGIGMVAKTVEGRLRWIERAISVAHPGGASGSYDVWVTATANDIDVTPLPNTDNTDYSFGLAISRTEPLTDLAESIAIVEWDGSAITRLIRRTRLDVVQASQRATPWEVVISRAGQAQSGPATEVALAENYAAGCPGLVSHSATGYVAFPVGTNVIPERPGWITEFRVIGRMRNVHVTQPTSAGVLRLRELTYRSGSPGYTIGAGLVSLGTIPAFGALQQDPAIVTGSPFTRPAWTRAATVWAILTAEPGPTGNGTVQVDQMQLFYRYI